jgi:O-methyltransferase domain/Dimerisation domain
MSVTASSRADLDQPLHALMFDAMAAKVVAAAAELRLADLLADGPRTSAELADRIGAHAPSLRRLLLALAGLGLVAQTDDDRFELTDMGGPLRADAPDSIRSLVEMLCGTEVWLAWGELVPSVLRGERGFERAHGMAVFEFYARHPEQSATFNAAMAEHTRDAAPGIVARADLSRFRTVMDIGGGDGTLMAEILRTHPELEGILFDLPQGLASAPGTLAAAGVDDRCRLTTGNAFEAVPAGADAYVLKLVLHDWDDDEATVILRNCRQAMAPDARLLILEQMVPERVTRDHAHTVLLDILMLLVPGGRERTEQEFRELLLGAGFNLTGFTEALPPYDYRVIEAAPA